MLLQLLLRGLPLAFMLVLRSAGFPCYYENSSDFRWYLASVVTKSLKPRILIQISSAQLSFLSCAFFSKDSKNSPFQCTYPVEM